MDAQKNLANQEVCLIARAADPQGLRTVGMMAKCYPVQGGDEPAVSPNIGHQLVDADRM